MSTFWLVFRIVECTLYGGLFLAFSLIIFSERRYKDKLKTPSNIKWSYPRLGWIISVLGIIRQVDPFADSVYPIWLFDLLGQMIYALILCTAVLTFFVAIRISYSAFTRKPEVVRRAKQASVLVSVFSIILALGLSLLRELLDVSVFVAFGIWIGWFTLVVAAGTIMWDVVIKTLMDQLRHSFEVNMRRSRGASVQEDVQKPNSAADDPGSDRPGSSADTRSRTRKLFDKLRGKRTALSEPATPVISRSGSKQRLTNRSDTSSKRSSRRGLLSRPTSSRPLSMRSRKSTDINANMLTESLQSFSRLQFVVNALVLCVVPLNLYLIVSICVTDAEDFYPDPDATFDALRVVFLFIPFVCAGLAYVSWRPIQTMLAVTGSRLKQFAMPGLSAKQLEHRNKKKRMAHRRAKTLTLNFAQRFKMKKEADRARRPRDDHEEVARPRRRSRLEAVRPEAIPLRRSQSDNQLVHVPRRTRSNRASVSRSRQSWTESVASVLSNTADFHVADPYTFAGDVSELKEPVIDGDGWLQNPLFSMRLSANQPAPEVSRGAYKYVFGDEKQSELSGVDDCT